MSQYKEILSADYIRMLFIETFKRDLAIFDTDNPRLTVETTIDEIEHYVKGEQGQQSGAIY